MTTITDQLAALVKALKDIAAIENQDFGSDWEEIEQARKIAAEALAAYNSAQKADGAESMDEKCERNARVQTRYDELMREGKRGHYETMFRVVREEVERGRQQGIEQANALWEMAKTSEAIEADQRGACSGSLPAAESGLSTEPGPTNGQPAASSAQEPPPGFALVPLRLTRAMDEVLQQEDWQWNDLLAAAEAITLEQYDEIAAAALAAYNSAQKAEESCPDPAECLRFGCNQTPDGAPCARFVEPAASSAQEPESTKLKFQSGYDSETGEPISGAAPARLAGATQGEAEQ